MNILDKISIMDECLDSHGGEAFCRISAWYKGGLIGELRYSYYEGKAWIQNIEVVDDYRRQGIATAMYNKLVEENGKENIIHLSTTDDGTKFKKSLEEGMSNLEHDLCSERESTDHKLSKIDDYFDKYYRKQTNQMFTENLLNLQSVIQKEIKKALKK